jgi:hypothetical protein
MSALTREIRPMPRLDVALARGVVDTSMPGPLAWAVAVRRLTEAAR